MNLEYYELVITTRAGVQTALVSSSAPHGGALSCEFDIDSNGGCADMTFAVARDTLQGSIALGSLVTFRAQLVGGSLTTYWTGVVTSRPATGTTARALEYEAKGLWYELGGALIVKYYEGADIDDVVVDILADIDTPVTAVSASASEISIASPYTVADIEAEFDNPTDVIAQLALMQGDVQYGVDQNGKLYFKDLSTADVLHYFVGQHLTRLDVREDVDAVVNDVYAQSKQVVGGGNLTLHRDDATSKAAYGTRAKLIQVRNTKVGSDVARYADSIIARYKNPPRVVEADLPGFSEFVFPRGQIRIVDNGTVYHLPIQRVAYKLDGVAGLVGSLSIGDRPSPKMEDAMLETVRRVERAQSGAISLTKIEHTGGEEFAQQALVDARLNGWLNTFYDTVADTKLWDPINTARVYVYDNALIVDPAKSVGVQLVSNGIPTGDVPTTVRLGFHFDANGRVSFANDGDVATFFESGAGNPPTDWRVDTARGMENFQNGNVVYYLETVGTGFELAANHGVAFRYNDGGVTPAGGGAAAYILCYVGYVDGANYVRIAIIRTAGTISAELATVVAGVTTVLDTLPITEGIDDYVIRLTYLDGSGHRLEVWDKDDTAVLHNGAYRSLTVPAGSRIGLDQWFDATVGIRAHVRWFEVEEPIGGGGVASPGSVFLSRKDDFDDAEFTAGIDMEGGWHGNPYIVFQDVDLTSLASGSTLRAWFRFRHPQRLKGWSISF